MASLRLQRGDQVSVHSLQKAAHFNGAVGTVVSEGPNADGRYTIRLDGTKKTIKVKGVNLELRYRAEVPDQLDALDGYQGPRDFRDWADKEEARVAEDPPPPWFDEGLGPEFAADGTTPSSIFEPHHIHILETFFLGADSDVSYRRVGGYMQLDEERKHPHTGLTALIQAVTQMDIPMMHAVLRSGAKVDFHAGDTHGTALQKATIHECLGEGSQRSEQRSQQNPVWKAQASSCPRRTPEGRSMGLVVDFLISVGADPSIQSGDPCFSPLEIAVRAGDLDLAEAMLCGPLGDRAMDRVPDALTAAQPHETIRKQFQRVVKRVKKRFATESRPARRCPCGSGRLFDHCHGQEEGVPIHPRQLCPCKPNIERSRRRVGVGTAGGKCYAKCCYKQRHFLRETFDGLIQPPMIIPGNSSLGKSMVEAEISRLEWIEAGNSPESWNIPMDGGTPTTYGGPTSAEMLEQGLLGMYGLLFERLGNQVDPAYVWATKRCDFYHARPFSTTSRSLPKGEKLKRQQEWNELIDQYIQQRPGDDQRLALEIEKANKVSWRGGPLFHRCGNPACRNVEDTPQQFNCCSACKVTRYCSKACAKAAWKVCHKADCGKSSAEPRLNSEFLLTTGMKELMGGLD